MIIVSDPTPAQERGDGSLTGAVAAQSRGWGVGPYAVVAILMITSVLSYLDRTLVGLMVDPIRHDLRISDTQVGLLSGFAVALFYALMGLPFGRWADKHNRKWLIVAGATGWSLATAACALTHSFAGLFGVRLLVGVGEATMGPAALSIISNLFPKHRLGVALALFSTGITIGNGAAIALGGALVQALQATTLTVPLFGAISGWRLVFAAVGLGGLPIAGVIAVLVREPVRQTLEIAPNLGAVFAQFRDHFSTYGLVMVGYSLMVIMSGAQALWGPAYFHRLHHMPIGQFGPFFGVVMGIGGTAGLLFGGAVSDFLTRRGVAVAPAKVILASIVLQTPLLITAYLVKDTAVALAFFAAGVVVLTLNGALQTATFQRVTPPRMLGSVWAIYLIFANLIGGGLGPVLIGGMSQHLAANGQRLGEALAAVTILVLPLAALLVLLALKPLAQSERRMALK
jgi:MFS family permease